MIIVGSAPAARRASATIEVVVVLPCEPLTVTVRLSRASSASISARGMIAMRRRRAKTTSGLSGPTAELVTTRPPTPALAGRCP